MKEQGVTYIPPQWPQINITIDANKVSKGEIPLILAEIEHYQYNNNAQQPSQPIQDKFGSRYGHGNMLEMADTQDPKEEFNYMTGNAIHVTSMSKLAMRMKWGPFSEVTAQVGLMGIQNTPFDHISIHRAKDRALIFLVKDGKPVTLEDDLNLFPSDDLCTRLRMLSSDTPTT